MPTALVPLVNGFEEIEAVVVVDVLRRAGVDVTTAAAGPPQAADSLARTGSHNITLQCDLPWEKARRGQYHLLVLPGGPGTSLLAQTPHLLELAAAQAKAGRWVAAICAAPSVLAGAGLLNHRRATCHPSVKDKMTGALWVDNPVVVDAPFLTANGPAAAMQFALALVDVLLGAESMRDVARAMQVR